MPAGTVKTHIGAAPSWPPVAAPGGGDSKARRAASFWCRKAKEANNNNNKGKANGKPAPAAAAPPPVASDQPKIAQMLQHDDNKGNKGVVAGAPVVADTAAAAGPEAAAAGASKAKPAHQGGCGPWFRRNWIPLLLLLLGLLGLLLALVFFFEPCPAIKMTTANPADVVIALDGSSSIAPQAYRQQLAAAGHLLGAKGLGATFNGDAANNYRAGVVQYSGCFEQETALPGVTEIVCPAGLNDATIAQKRAARIEMPLTGDVGAVTALLDRAADASAPAGGDNKTIAQLQGFTWFGAALVNCAAELEARGQGHGAGAARRGVCITDATATEKATSTTTVEAACDGDGQTWHELGPPLGLCVLISDGSNNDGSWQSVAGGAEYDAAHSFGVYTWCETHGLAAAGACTAAGIADYLKTTLKIKIMGIFVDGGGAGASSPAAVAAGQACMKRFSSCNAGATANDEGAPPVNATGCSFYAQADNFEALAGSAKAIGASLGTEVGSTNYFMCTTDPTWFNFLWLFLPLLLYLLWRPATLLLAGVTIRRRREKLDAAAAPSRDAQKAVELAALEAGAAGAGGVAAEAVPPVAAGKGRRRKWTLVAADHYLWNLGGAGAAPMRVDFGAGVAPPSAPKQNAQRRARRSVFAWEAPSAKDVYEPHEPQPGDLDFEYTRLWMNALSCACCPLWCFPCCTVPVDDPQTNAARAAAAGGGKAGATGPRVVSGIGGTTPQAGALVSRQPSLMAPPACSPSAPQV